MNAHLVDFNGKGEKNRKHRKDARLKDVLLERRESTGSYRQRIEALSSSWTEFGNRWAKTNSMCPGEKCKKVTRKWRRECDLGRVSRGPYLTASLSSARIWAPRRMEQLTDTGKSDFRLGR